MKNIKKLSFLLSLILNFSLLLAQENKKITIDEAVEMGIKNSKYLKIDAAKISQATVDLLDAKNRQLPDFKLSASYLRLGNAKADLKFLNSSSGNNSPTPNSVLLGQANLSLPLYAGGKIKYGIESAKYLVEATKLKSENNRLAISYNISEAYNNLFKAKQGIKILEENLSVSEKRDETFLKLEKNGLLARNDRLKANIQTSNIELQILEAKNNYAIANFNMNLLLGLDENTILEIDENYIDQENEVNFYEYYWNTALENRKDIQAVAMQIKAAELGTKSAKAENLPTIALSGGYIAADVPKILSVYNAVNIGVGINYNIGNLWKKNSSLMKSEAIENELSANNELLFEQIKLEINKAYQNVIFAKDKTLIYEKISAQATENYSIVKRKFDNGLATITELLEADAAKITTEINTLNSKADASLAYRKLLQSSGISIKN